MSVCMRASFERRVPIVIVLERSAGASAAGSVVVDMVGIWLEVLEREEVLGRGQGHLR
jgi:hypothetical protein